MKIFITILISSFLLSNVANAKGKMIFDLKRQYFSGTLIKKGEANYNKEAQYDLDNVFVTTDTVFFDPAYKWGLFTVDIKEPLKNWNVNIKKKNGNGINGELSAIRLTSDIGSSHFITFMAGSHGDDSIQINNKNFNIKHMDKKTFNVSISSKENKSTFSINGKHFLKIEATEFGLLSKVEIEVSGSNEYQDELYSFDISRAD